MRGLYQDHVTYHSLAESLHPRNRRMALRDSSPYVHFSSYGLNRRADGASRCPKPKNKTQRTAISSEHLRFSKHGPKTENSPTINV